MKKGYTNVVSKDEIEAQLGKRDELTISRCSVKLNGSLFRVS